MDLEIGNTDVTSPKSIQTASAAACTNYSQYFLAVIMVVEMVDPLTNSL